MSRHVVGILGAGFIAPTAVIQPSRRRDDVTVHAVGSRDLDKANAYALANRIPIAYSSYEQVIADPDITIIYNALPPSEHAKWSIAALEAGKHVLCEKPIALDAHEAKLIAETGLAAGLQVTEAFHDRYHPLFLYLLELTQSGRLGTITEVTAEVSIQTVFNPDSFRHNPRTGGGALMEFGCYPVRWLRNVIGEEPVVISANAELNPLGADSRMEATLEFPSGAKGMLLADGLSTTPGVQSRITVTGDHGKVEILDPIVPHSGHSIQEWIGDTYEVRTVGGVASYDYQLAAVLSAIETGVPSPTSAADFVPNMKLIDDIFASAGMVRTTL
ncbi:Gfo/Idh/MocA family protein [Homoserinimonas sp. A447]